MEAVHFSETLVNFYQTAWHHIPEDIAVQNKSGTVVSGRCIAVSES
jgi:hypothetical protein